mgnify:CR=1 FL=1
MSTTPSAPRSATVLWAGALACALSVVVTIATQGALRDGLAAAYTYTADRTLEAAQSATLTYLFTIAGLGLIFYTAYALAARRAGRSGIAAWLSVGLLVLASALAISLPASIAVSTALAQTRGQRAHLMADPLCRTSVIDGLHMMLRGEQLPPPHRSGCDYRWNGRAK